MISGPPSPTASPQPLSPHPPSPPTHLPRNPHSLPPNLPNAGGPGLTTTLTPAEMARAGLAPGALVRPLQAPWSLQTGWRWMLFLFFGRGSQACGPTNFDAISMVLWWSRAFPPSLPHGFALEHGVFPPSLPWLCGAWFVLDYGFPPSLPWFCGGVGRMLECGFFPLVYHGFVVESNFPPSLPPGFALEYGFSP